MFLRLVEENEGGGKGGGREGGKKGKRGKGEGRALQAHVHNKLHVLFINILEVS